MAIDKAKHLRKLRDQYRNNYSINKYTTSGRRFFIAYNIPGWPSKAFNRYIQHLYARISITQTPTLHTLIFAITKKCGFKCAHCCEWENLNKPEQLTREQILEIAAKYWLTGTAQFILIPTRKVL